MTKEDIYEKIGYNGKYDTKIKTNLRNLIKENKNDAEVSSTLLEVQDELETGKAKINYNHNKGRKGSDIESKERIESVSVKKKKPYEKKEKVKKKNVKKKKKKSSSASIIAKIFIVLMALLMIASSVSTIFSYFR